MHHHRRVAVLGRRFTGLLEFARKLNGLGLFKVTLRNRPEELLELLEAGERFDALFFDGFELERDGASLEALAWYDSIDLTVLVADVNSSERRHILEWAHERSLHSVQVLQLPVRQEDLELMVLRPVFNLNPRAANQ